MKIIFSQKLDVVKWNENDEGIIVDDPAALKSLDGFKYDEELFCDYILDGAVDKQNFEGLPISGGILYFKYNKKTNEVFVLTEYEVGDLSDKNIEDLKMYTASHWTDGIGSGLSQGFESDLEIFPSFIGEHGDIKVEICRKA